jgi:hypothetical protein
MGAIANLNIDQGATFSSDISVKDLVGNALNLTGYTVTAKMAKSYSSTATKTPITASINTSTGMVSLSLTASQTAALDAARYVYDVKITDSFNQSTRIVEGIMTVRPQVSTS